MKLITQNKKANFEYTIVDRIEAGINLKGSEVKSIRKGKTNIDDAYIVFKNQEAFILNMHVSIYDQSSIFNHVETRTRKLLLNKSEIIKLNALKQEKSFTVIPTKVYLKEGLIKLEIALAKGKKLYDKRESIKERDINRYERSLLTGKKR